MVKKMYDWMGKQAHTPQAPFFLAFLSFLESLVFPPVAPLLILFCIENRRRSFFYAAVVTLSSVCGGILAYYCGYALWETIGKRLVLYVTSQEHFDTLVTTYDRHESLAVLIGSFAPVPYRLIGISAGFCKLPLLPFITASLLGRGARYFLVGIVLYIWGNHIKVFIDRWFTQLVLLFLVIMLAGFFLVLKRSS